MQLRSTVGEQRPSPRRMAGPAIALSLLAVTLAAACKSPAERARVLTKDQQQAIRDNILAAAPTPKAKLDADFEGHIKLLGYDLDGEAKAGATVALTMYLQVTKPVSGDWKIFVHFEAPGKRRQPFDHYGVGDLYPVGEWKAGEIIKDRIEMPIPEDWPGGPAQVLIGFFDWGAWSKASQNRRLKIATSDASLLTNDDRLILTTLQVAGGRAPTERRPAAAAGPGPTLRVPRLATAPQIDGPFDGPGWREAAATPAFRQPDGKPLRADIKTEARLGWDDANLYVAFRSDDSEIVNRFAEHDATLWEGDVVEIFLQPDDGGATYYELQIAPNAATFDAKFTGPRQPAWQEARAWESQMKSAVVVDGSANGDGADAKPDRGWSATVAIPWAAFGLSAAPKGRTWKANLYRIDNKGTHDMASMGAWVPVGGDFHALEPAGRLVFAE